MLYSSAGVDQDVLGHANTLDTGYVLASLGFAFILGIIVILVAYSAGCGPGKAKSRSMSGLLINGGLKYVRSEGWHGRF